MIWRVLPLAGAVLLVGIPLCWRPWLHYRRHGSWGIALFRSRRPGQLVRDSLAVVAFLLLLGQGFAAAAWPGSIAPLGAASALSLAVRRAVGALLLLGGLSFLVAAQLDLGASWRIGIEEDARPGLRTGGLYSVCRNPIYVGLLVTIAGYALLLPTRLSLVLLLGTGVGIRQQVAAEESYLLTAYGESYRAYARRVGRFVPGLGRLR